MYLGIVQLVWMNMIQVNPGECSISTTELEQGQDSHLTSNQQFWTCSYFWVGSPNFSRKFNQIT